jgi:hypothetical protein
MWFGKVGTKLSRRQGGLLISLITGPIAPTIYCKKISLNGLHGLACMAKRGFCIPKQTLGIYIKTESVSIPGKKRDNQRGLCNGWIWFMSRIDSVRLLDISENTALFYC